MDDIERIFNTDCRYKKRIGNNVSKRASRKGFIRGGVKTAYDFMNTKERKKLNGEVRIYNMYDKLENIPKNFDEIVENTDKTKAYNILKNAKENFTVKQLRDYWGISHYKYYTYCKKFGLVDYSPQEKTKMSSKIDKVDKVDKVKKEIAPSVNEPVMDNPFQVSLSELNNALDEIKSLKNDLIAAKDNNRSSSDFEFKFNGTYSKSELDDRLLSISNLTIDGKKYSINVTLKEIFED